MRFSMFSMGWSLTGVPFTSKIRSPMCNDIRSLLMSSLKKQRTHIANSNINKAKVCKSSILSFHEFWGQKAHIHMCIFKKIHYREILKWDLFPLTGILPTEKPNCLSSKFINHRHSFTILKDLFTMNSIQVMFDTPWNTGQNPNFQLKSLWQNLQPHWMQHYLKIPRTIKYH